MVVRLSRLIGTMRAKTDPVGTLFFCHIPKTAGTSFRIFLETVLSAESMIPSASMIQDNRGLYPPISKVIKRIDQRRDEAVTVCGHYHLSLRHKLNNPKTIVLLRDPVERAISEIRHHIRTGHFDKVEVERVLRSGKVPLRDNTMTRYLAGSIGDGSAAATQKEMHRLLSAPIDAGEDRLGQAIAALAEVDVVGFVEQMEDFSAEIEKLLGVKPSRHRHNVGQQDVLEFDDQMIDTVRQANQLDQQLYNEALKLKARRELVR